MITREQLLQRLRECVGAQSVLTEPAALAPFLVDHRELYHGNALATVLPATTAEVSAVLALCHETRTPVVPQGGNTGYCGGATPDGSGQTIVLALARMNRVRGVDPDNFSLTVEAGCTLAAAQASAAQANRLFPLSLGSEGTCQIGGNLATNAGGTAVLRFGMMRDLVLGLEFVLADGGVVSALSPLRKDNTGYDLRHLMIGSEGTLGVITAACLKLFPRPRTTATAWLAVPDPALAVRVLALLREAGGDRLTGCELVPDVALRLVLEHLPSARPPGTAAAPWYLLVEMTDSGTDDINATLEAALATALERGLIEDAVLARSQAQRDALWALRENVPAAQRRAGGSLKHDISVPVAALPAFIERGAQIAAELAPEGYLVAYGHAGDGNLHFNLNQRAGADRDAFLAREAPLKRAIHDLVAQMHGSFSAEHGIGALKVDELARYAPAAELQAMRRIKQALDPHGILNPGKVLRSSP